MNKITDIRLSFTVIRSVSFNVTFCFYTSCRLQKTMYLPSLYDQTLRIWDGSLDLVPECNLFFIIFLWNSIFIPFNNFKGTVIETEKLQTNFWFGVSSVHRKSCSLFTILLLVKFTSVIFLKITLLFIIFCFLFFFFPVTME